MQKIDHQQKVNPLAGLMRQPKLFVKLPSQGHFWPKGSLNSAVNGEYAVYSMTAKDEIMLKNPATQVGGQILVDVIQSCIPDIKNAWDIPSIDLDAILIAIRIATFGPVLKVSFKYKEVDETYDVDLREVLDSLINNVMWNGLIDLENGMTAVVRPLTYSSITLAGQESSETQKIMNIVNNDKLDDDKKVELFKQSFVKLTDIAISAVAESVEKIITHDQVEVVDRAYIDEFIQQCDRKTFNIIQSSMAKLNQHNSIKPVKVAATPLLISAGSQEIIELPVKFSSENFFALYD